MESNYNAEHVCNASMILKVMLLCLVVDGLEDSTDVWMVARRAALLAIRMHVFSWLC